MKSALTSLLAGDHCRALDLAAAVSAHLAAVRSVDGSMAGDPLELAVQVEDLGDTASGVHHPLISEVAHLRTEAEVVAVLDSSAEAALDRKMLHTGADYFDQVGRKRDRLL